MTFELDTPDIFTARYYRMAYLVTYKWSFGSTGLFHFYSILFIYHPLLLFYPFSFSPSLISHFFFIINCFLFFHSIFGKIFDRDSKRNRIAPYSGGVQYVWTKCPLPGHCCSCKAMRSSIIHEQDTDIGLVWSVLVGRGRCSFLVTL